MRRRCALITLCLLGTLGCNKVLGPQVSTNDKPPSPSIAPTNEREIAYMIEREEAGRPQGAPEDYQFHSDDRFRLRFRPGFPAYIYVANRGEYESSCHVLFPNANERGQNPLAKGTFVAIPNDKEWLHFDDRPGNEFFYLIASTVPLTDFEQAPAMPRDSFDVKLAQIERQYQPSSSRRFQDGNLTKFFAAREGDLALVVRLNLQHQ